MGCLVRGSRLNLWNLHTSRCCFNLVDAKPPSMEALSEVITSADFHPSHCHTFLYSSCRGCIRVGDMRSSALCDKQVRALRCALSPLLSPDPPSVTTLTGDG